jgi:hypothetical protein
MCTHTHWHVRLLDSGFIIQKYTRDSEFQIRATDFNEMHVLGYIDVKY